MDGIRVGLLSLVVLAILPAGAWAQFPDRGPPFREAEIVVAGQPGDLPPGLQALKYLPHADLTVVRAESGQEWGLVQRLRAQGRRAGLNYIAEASETPNDPLYPFQWHLEQVQAEQAWDLTTGSGVTVAVLDTGLAAGGLDGIGCVVAGNDVVNEDSDPSDGEGHGTHVAGTIAQRTGNDTGAAGLAYAACVMPVKVLDDNGSGSFADIADGIYYAVNNGAQVVNMSLGTNAQFGITNDALMDPALDYAYTNGVTVVCAAGNDGHRKNVSYPAIYPTTIAVGATDYRNGVPRYSNRGAGLDLVAPGGDLSRDLNGDGFGDGVLQETFGGGGWGYYFFQGTSMASPHVAAAAALLLSHGSAAGPDDVYVALTSTALDLGEPGYDRDSGHGLAQLHAALLYACTDGDADGWCAESGDCNDADPDVSPNAQEICGDGVDNNCEGTVDEGCAACADADVDGWCVEDGDCNDDNGHIYPGHNDTKGKWGRNGVDNDCNGIIDG